MTNGETVDNTLLKILPRDAWSDFNESPAQLDHIQWLGETAACLVREREEKASLNTATRPPESEAKSHLASLTPSTIIQ